MKKSESVNLSDFPLVSETDIIAPEQSNAGEKGYGEGIKFVVNEKSRLYFYRFAGKRIPRHGIAYLTSEDSYFSRVKGERNHIVVTWDENANGFRVLLSEFRSGFKNTYSNLSKLKLEDIVDFVRKEKAEKIRANAKLVMILDNIENLF